jgi:hypothetical protein
LIKKGNNARLFHLFVAKKQFAKVTIFRVFLKSVAAVGQVIRTNMAKK